MIKRPGTMSATLTVFGATGTQGGSVIRAVLQHPTLSKQYKIRGVTRDVKKEASRILEESGVEMVQADLNDLDSVKQVVKGSAVVYGVTDFWQNGASAETEMNQGKHMVDAAVDVGAFFIWSTLPSPREMSGGILQNAQQFEGKAAVEAYVKERGVPCAFVVLASYMELFKNFFAPRQAKDGKIYLSVPFNPDTELPLIYATVDVGKFVAPILKDPTAFNGVKMIGADKYYTLDEVVKTFSDVTGTPVELEVISDDKFWNGVPEVIANSGRDFTRFTREYDPLGLNAKTELQNTLQRMDDKPESLESYLRNNGPWFK